MKMLAVIALAVAAPASAQTPAPLAGVWSIGQTRNCTAGPAWAFLADGIYAEVTLPDRGPSAIGLWKDEGTAIAFTHSHMPFPKLMETSQMLRLTIERRTADMLVMRNRSGEPRIFHRCPADALKAPAKQGAH